MPEKQDLDRNILRLRRRIVKLINGQWSHLGCYIIDWPYPEAHRNDYKNRLLWGVGKLGSALLLYVADSPKLPMEIRDLMLKYESCGAIVGCVFTIGDAWDVCYDEPSVYKRKPRTYEYRSNRNLRISPNKENEDE